MWTRLTFLRTSIRFKLFIYTFIIQHCNENKLVYNAERDHCLFNAPPIITLKTVMINVKTKQCGIIDRYNYIFMKEQPIHTSLILKLLIIAAITYYCAYDIIHIWCIWTVNTIMDIFYNRYKSYNYKRIFLIMCFKNINCFNIANICI